MSDPNQQIIESLTSGIIVFDADSKLVASNSKAAETLDVERSKLVPGVRLDQLPLPGQFREFVQSALKQQRPLDRQEVLLREEDGQKKEIGLSASLLHGQNKFNGIVFLFVDMTERRALERAAELNRQLAQIGGLTAGVVHELRNPLSVISGLAELIERKSDDGDQRKKNARAIVEEARSMERSIGQFLSFARPFELEPTVCGPRSIVQRAMALSHVRAEKKRVTLELRPSSGLPEIHADLNKLAQALNNIISNAIDAVEVGGLVAVDVYTDDDDIIFEIMDNGPGVHVAAYEDIFNPFFTKKESGTGLGLGICSRIVDSHGGSVSYKNGEEGGAIFTVRLPVQRKPRQ